MTDDDGTGQELTVDPDSPIPGVISERPEPQRVRLDQGFTAAAIKKHLDRQRGVAVGYVKLDSGVIVRVGSDADGEGNADGPSALLRNIRGDDGDN